MALAAGGFISAFPTRLLGEYIGEDEPERVAVTIYGINLFLASVLVSALWRFAVRERLIRSDIADTDVRMITRRLAPGLAGYLVVIVVGLFLPVLAVLGYLVIAVYIIVPFGTLRRRRGCDMTREGRPANLTRVKRLDDAVVIRLAATTDLMDGDGSFDKEATRRRIGRIVVRGEFGPLLAAALPECQIAVVSGETHITAQVRDEAELFGVLERLRDLGAALVSVSIDP
jgi:hypothetical protein